MIEEPLRNGDVERRLRKEHAEKLQAARREVDEAESQLCARLNSGVGTSFALIRLIDAKVELALLERGS